MRWRKESEMEGKKLRKEERSTSRLHEGKGTGGF